MREPSRSIQHSSTPAPRAGARAVEVFQLRSATLKSSRSEDNFSPSARLYLCEHRLCSLHEGSFGSPFFATTGNNAVILSAADGSRSESPAKSKDPLHPCATTSVARHSRPAFWAAAQAAAFLFFLSSFFSTRIPLSTCFSSSKNGGKNLTTVSCVELKSTPSAKAASTIGRAGIAKLIP
jgi:hypothetical protein